MQIPVENILFVALIFSAFFSGMEIAFISSSKLRIELAKKQGTLSGRILAKFMNAPSHYIVATLVGNNIALVIYGLAMARVIRPFIIEHLPISFHGEIYILSIQTLVSTFIILLLGEFLPKIIFRLSADKVLNFFAIPFAIIYYLLYPVVELIVLFSKFTLNKVLKTGYKEDKPAFGRVDLLELIDDHQTGRDNLSKIDTELFENALKLGNAKVKECVVPRTEIEAVDITTSIEAIKEKVIETKLSKIIIYKDSLDNVLGYVHHFELWKNPKDIESIIIPMPVVPESMSAQELLNIFISQRKSMALVVDEFGGTAGIVTLEDILEEIFGEIEDEHDLQEFIERKINDKELLLSGRLEIDHLNEKYNLKIPEGDYETLGGFIIAHCGDIPKINEVIIINHLQITVLLVSDTKIETVRLKILS